MSKFCTKCGKELEEGKKCDCEKNKKEVKETVKASESSSISADDIKDGGKDCLEIVKGIFTKPFDVIKNFATEKKYIAGAIMLIITAIANGLCRIASLKNLYSDSASDAINGSDFAHMTLNYMKEPSYVEEFFKAFGYGLLEYAFVAVVGYFLITKLLKGTATLKQVIAIAGVSFTVVALAFLVNAGLVYIDSEFVSYVRTYITTLGFIFSIIIFYVSIADIAGVDKNKLLFTVAGAFISGNAIVDFVFRTLE